jgi:sec-independent protein translocase protein TatA
VHPFVAEIFGVDGIIVLVVVLVVLFGGSQIPKLARSLGSAQSQFKKGLEEGKSDAGSGAASTTEGEGSGASKG